MMVWLKCKMPSCGRIREEGFSSKEQLAGAVATNFRRWPCNYCNRSGFSVLAENEDLDAESRRQGGEILNPTTNGES